MMHRALLTGLLLVGSIFTSAPVEARVFPEATAPARLQQRQQQERQVRPDNYDLSRHPVTDANESFWRNMLWTTAIVEPQEAYVADAIAGILVLTPQPGLSDSRQRTIEMAMQVGTQLYLSNPTLYSAIGQQFRRTVEQSPNPEWVAIALSGLAAAGLEPQQRQQLSDRVRQRFPQWSNNVHLYTTLQDLAALDNPALLPPLSDLLGWTIAPGQLQLYVVCGADRGALCQTILKDGNGQFVRRNGQLWSAPLLLRSLHSLSWNFTRGQTPQGVYRIEGTRPQPDTSQFRAYGQFSLVKLFVPYEEGVREFLPGQDADFSGGLAAYQTLLPPSWRNYFPIQQSYWAGKAGRGLFRIHGTGEDPNFFSNSRRYPTSANWTPSIGCLSALELYDETGRLQQGDMAQILQVLTAAGGANFTGYLIVVEASNSANQPLSLGELEAAIAQSSQINASAQ